MDACEKAAHACMVGAPDNAQHTQRALQLFADADWLAVTAAMIHQQPQHYTSLLVQRRMRWQQAQATMHLQRDDGAAQAGMCARTGLLLLLQHLAGGGGHPTPSRAPVRRRWSLQPTPQGPLLHGGLSLQHAARAVRRARSTSLLWGLRAAPTVDVGADQEGWRACIQQGVGLLNVLRKADCSVQARRDAVSVCKTLLRVVDGLPDEAALLRSVLAGL